MAHRNRFAAATALAAAFSLAAMPSLAHDHHHRWHDHDGINGGAVLAGALIHGGIAAIAGAVSKQDREDCEPAPPSLISQDRQGYSYRGADRDMGLDRAADTGGRDVLHTPRNPYATGSYPAQPPNRPMATAAFVNETLQ